jgi:hypothetical protein
MKRIVMISLMLVLVVALIATPIMAKGGKTCTRIQDGVLTYSAGHYLGGEPLKVGYDIFGYNYHAHLFNGYYCNIYLGGAGFPPYDGDTESYLAANPGAESHWAWPYRDTWVNMKWNDAWLSNKDCNGDGILDRPSHADFGGTYIGSGAWETNHMRGEDENGKWTYFVKIVAAPADAYVVDVPNDPEDPIPTWFTADGIEIGPVIWGSFAVIQEVESGIGAYYVSPSGPGFGKW